MSLALPHCLLLAQWPMSQVSRKSMKHPNTERITDARGRCRVKASFDSPDRSARPSHASHHPYLEASGLGSRCRIWPIYSKIRILLASPLFTTYCITQTSLSITSNTAYPHERTSSRDVTMTPPSVTLKTIRISIASRSWTHLGHAVLGIGSPTGLHPNPLPPPPDSAFSAQITHKSTLLSRSN